MVASADSPKTLAEAEATVSRLAEMNRRYNGRVVAIAPPAGAHERARIARLAKLLAAEEAVIAGLLKTLRDGDPTQIVALNDRLVILAERESTLLVELGATDCGL